MAKGAFKSRESYEYFADGQVRDLQAWLKLNFAHWYTIYKQSYPRQGLKLTPVCYSETGRLLDGLVDIC